MEFATFVEKYNLPVDTISTHKLYISYLKGGKPLEKEKEKSSPPTAPPAAPSNSGAFSSNMGMNLNL